MAYGELFRHFTIRFSLKKAQHVKLLQLFEDKKRNGGKAKNQVVMDALEMYYDAQADADEKAMLEEITPEYFEKRLAGVKEEIKTEILQEVFRIVMGNAVAGQMVQAAVPPVRESEPEETEGDGVADISGMPDIMDKVMGWSKN